MLQMLDDARCQSEPQEGWLMYLLRKNLFQELVIVDYQGPAKEHMRGWHFPLRQLGRLWEVISRQESVIIKDVRDDTPMAQAYRQGVGEKRSSWSLCSPSEHSCPTFRLASLRLVLTGMLILV
jgi:hypothetical protein